MRPISELSTHKCIGAGCAYCLQARQIEDQFSVNRERYALLLVPYGFEIGTVEAHRAEFTHKNGWTVFLFADRHWSLVDPAKKPVRTDVYLNDLESALSSRCQSGLFVK